MKESYSEGIANHTGFGSYAGIREDAGGTLIEVHAGWVFSREIVAKNQGADVVLEYGRQYRLAANAYVAEEPCEV